VGTNEHVGERQRAQITWEIEFIKKKENKQTMTIQQKIQK